MKHLYLVALVLIAGCGANATVPTTQPTAQGVLAADALVQGYTTAAKLEVSVIQSGTIDAATVAKIKADDSAAYGLILGSGSSALSGSSGLTAATTALTTLESDLNVKPSTKP